MFPKGRYWNNSKKCQKMCLRNAHNRNFYISQNPRVKSKIRLHIHYQGQNWLGNGSNPDFRATISKFEIQKISLSSVDPRPWCDATSSFWDVGSQEIVSLLLSSGKSAYIPTPTCGIPQGMLLLLLYF